MTAQRPSSPRLFAPGASSHAAYAPGRGDARPPIHARLATPEANEEVVDGVRVEVMGALPPHAKQHLEVARLFGGCIAPGYLGAIDMLTRLDEDNDRAPDVSVFPEAPDPLTGERALEEIAFEVRDTESLTHVSKKARAFIERGVRRFFYIRLSDRSLFEWDHVRGDWTRLPEDAEIRDRCFRVPLPVRAFTSRVVADNAVANALLAARNPVLTEALRKRQSEGRDEGLQPLVHLFTRKLGRPLAATERDRLRERLTTLGAERLGDVVLDLDRDALAAWLTAPDAR